MPHLVLLAAAPVLLYGYRYHVGLDGVSFLSVAQLYAEGRWTEAINGYWGPLLPWLTVPGLLAGLPPIVAGHLAVVVGAVGVVSGVQHAARTVGASRTAADVLALVVVPFCWGAVTYGVFADLLVAGLLLHVVAVLAGDRPALLQHGVLAGLAAGAAYLAKAVALPVVLVAVAVAVLTRTVGARALREHLPSLAAVTATALLIAGAWSLVLATRYGAPTFSTAAGYNLDVLAPGSAGNPIRYAGLLEPPSVNAISAWDEPSLIEVESDGWGGDPDRAVRRIGQNLTRNLARAWDATLDQLPVLVLLGAVGLVAGVLRPGHREATLVLTAAGGAYLAAHLFTFVEPRYLWPPALLLVPLAAPLLDRLHPRGTLPLVGAALLLAVGVALPMADGAALRWGSGEQTRAIARRLAPDISGEPIAAANNWQRGAIVCLHTGCRFHGIPATDGPELTDQLLERGIRFYLVWQPAAEDVPRPARAERSAVYGDLVVYEVARSGRDRGQATDPP